MLSKISNRSSYNSLPPDLLTCSKCCLSCRENELTLLTSLWLKQSLQLNNFEAYIPVAVFVGQNALILCTALAKKLSAVPFTYSLCTISHLNINVRHNVFTIMATWWSVCVLSGPKNSPHLIEKSSRWAVWWVGIINIKEIGWFSELVP